MADDFVGAKLVLMVGQHLLAMRRDDRPDILFPDMWDMPGGGREGNETPEDCVLRETSEELSIELSPSMLEWKQEFESPVVCGGRSWWFAARLSPDWRHRIMLGDEGQYWCLMPAKLLLADPHMIDHTRPRIAAGLAALGVETH